jgi:hypothetical protein
MWKRKLNSPDYKNLLMRDLTIKLININKWYI